MLGSGSLQRVLERVAQVPADVEADQPLLGAAFESARMVEASTLAPARQVVTTAAGSGVRASSHPNQKALSGYPEVEFKKNDPEL